MSLKSGEYLAVVIKTRDCISRPTITFIPRHSWKLKMRSSPLSECFGAKNSKAVYTTKKSQFILNIPVSSGISKHFSLSSIAMLLFISAALVGTVINTRRAPLKPPPPPVRTTTPQIQMFHIATI